MPRSSRTTPRRSPPGRRPPASWRSSPPARRPRRARRRPPAPPRSSRRSAGSRSGPRWPPSDARLATYSKLFMAGSSNSDGAQAVISAMLQSPYFLYRLELGKQSGSSFALTPYEVGSELAYTLTGTAPDSTLLTAADSVNSGSLIDVGDDRPQAMRLVASGAASNSHRGDGVHERLAGAAAPLHDRQGRHRLHDVGDHAERDADGVAGPHHGGVQRQRDLRLGADRRPLLAERGPGDLLRHPDQRPLDHLHERQVRRAHHARSGAAGDGDDPERLRPPRHRLAHPARPPGPLADALPGHPAAAAGAEHDLHARRRPSRRPAISSSTSTSRGSAPAATS